MNKEKEVEFKLHQEVESKHCKAQKAEIIAYDNVGWALAKCGCGKFYNHNIRVN